MSASRPLLQLAGLSAGYAGVPVVRGLDLEVRPGEVVALLGRNGAGKTTTLLTAAGLLRSIAGTVQVLGRDIASSGSLVAARLAREGLGYVPDDRGLFPNMTVRENLRVAVGRRRPRLDRVLELFPKLNELMGRRVCLLSGGEQQMLAIARALARGPRLLLVDELSLGLAPIVVGQIMPALRTIANESGVAVLLVEQHVHLALELADRAYVLDHGELVVADSADALRNGDVDLERAYLGGLKAASTVGLVAKGDVADDDLR